MKDSIIVRGARQHNLKGFDLEIPRRAFTVITGPSGSGKSSLAFDTIYAEGQRRYVESLSAYARQFLERMEKPDVDSIDGLSPAVAIEQKNPTKTSRSTVGTATEIYDYLRLLWARVGRTFCPLCGREMRPDTVQSVVRRGSRAAGRNALLRRLPAASVRRSDARSRRREPPRAGLRSRRRRRRDQAPRRADDRSASTSPSPSNCSSSSTGSSVGDEARGRLADAVGTAFREGDGDCVILFTEPIQTSLTPTPSTTLRFTERYECANDGTRAPTPTPQLFSFNSPRGACESLQRIRRHARVRRGAHRPVPRRAACATARSIRGRSRATTTSGARSPSSRSARASRWTRRGRSCPRRRAQKLLNAQSARLQGHSSLPRRSRGEEVQAVHPRLPSAVSDGAGMSRLPRHQAATGGASGSRRRAQHRRGERAAGRSPARVARDARAQRRSSGRSPRTFSRRRATACSSSATSGSTT